jgi:hypothetical protein
MPRSNKTLKAITTEAKAIRKNKPSITWQNAIKQASKFYNDTVKPTAKKVAKTTKRVYSATKKGYAVARNEYKRSTVGATRKYEIDTPLVEDLFLYMESEPLIMKNYERDFLPNVARKVGAGKLNKALLPKLFEYLYKNHKRTIERYYGSQALNPAERKALADLWTEKAIDDLSGNYDTLYNGRTGKYEPIEKFTKGNIIGKVGLKISRTGTRSVRTGSSNRIGMGLTKKKAKNIPTLQKFIKTGVPANKGVKPKKPSLSDLKKANIEFFEGYRKLGVKEQKVFYSPILNKYILIQKIDPSKFTRNNTMLYKTIRYYAFIINHKSNKVASMPDYVAGSIEQINSKFLTKIID